MALTRCPLTGAASGAVRTGRASERTFIAVHVRDRPRVGLPLSDNLGEDVGKRPHPLRHLVEAETIEEPS